MMAVISFFAKHMASVDFDFAMEAASRDFFDYVKTQIGTRQDPNGYMGWNAYLAQWLTEIRVNRERGFIDAETADKFGLSLHAHCCNIPPRYVSEEMMNAWRHTKVPKLTWNRPDVLPGYVLFLPIPTPSKRRLIEDARKKWFTTCRDIAIMVWDTPQGLLTYTFYAKQVKSSGRLGLGSMSFLVQPDDDYNDWDPVVADVARCAINSWLVHAHEPELIEQAPARLRGGFGVKRQDRSPIAPTWIGRNFKVRRESAPAAGQETGIKVRPHWRSGHWHTVRHGKGREQERLQWYRPTYVNADS